MAHGIMMRVASCQSVRGSGGAARQNRMSVVRVSNLAGIDALVTDAEPPKNLRKMLDAAGVEVLIAK